MSIAIIGKDSLELLGKFFTLTKSEERALNLIKSYHELNVKNFSVKYNDEFPLYEDFDITNQPLIAPEQALKTLESLHYNCIDYGEQIDKETLQSIRREIEKILLSYSINERAHELAKWG